MHLWPCLKDLGCALVQRRPSTAHLESHASGFSGGGGANAERDGGDPSGHGGGHYGQAQGERGDQQRGEHAGGREQHGGGDGLHQRQRSGADAGGSSDEAEACEVCLSVLSAHTALLGFAVPH